MANSTTDTLTARLLNGDEVSITSNGYTVGGATTGSITWTDATSDTLTVGGSGYGTGISPITVTPTITPTICPYTSPYPTPFTTTPYISPTPHTIPHTTPYIPYTPPYTVVEDETEERFEPPRCGQCRTDVSLIQSFVKDDMLIMVFSCHGEKRRVDISLKRFKGNEKDAKEYLLEQIDWLFCEEDDWRELKPKTVITPNADRDAVRDWLTAS